MPRTTGSFPRVIRSEEAYLRLQVDHLDALATLGDGEVQARLLREVIRDYVSLEARVDSLLKNTLPASVAEEIKYRGSFAPRDFDCSILFTDLVHFTQLAEILPPDALVQVLPSDPGDPWQPIRTALFQGIAGARRRAWLTSPYFVPDESLRTVLLAAALRGMDVRILLPGRSDMRLVRAAGRSYYSELLRAGVRIYEYQAGFVHAKTLVVDDTVASVGSANMDIRSFELNHEMNVLVSDATLVKHMEGEFLRDLKDATEILPEAWEARPYVTRLKENTARLLSPLL